MKKKLALSALFFVLFVVLIALVSGVDVAPIGPNGTSIGLSGINKAVHDALGTHMILHKLTQVLGYGSILLALCFALAGLVQWIKRRSLKKVDRVLWALAGLYVLVAAVYVIFEKVVVNYRPILMPGEVEPEASFPSSHTMLFCVILGSAAMLYGWYNRRAKSRRLVQGICAAAIVVGSVCRLASGVHWFTDILGGVLISAALLLLFSAMLEKGRE